MYYAYHDKIEKQMGQIYVLNYDKWSIKEKERIITRDLI